jgi:hypothetical protein
MVIALKLILKLICSVFGIAELLIKVLVSIIMWDFNYLTEDEWILTRLWK